MSLAAGQRLGPYEIVSPLGAGGMGEVYRARDTRLGRDVAVKVLPRELAADPERRLRLEREAQAISALSHPHVCALFDVGSADLPGGPVEFLVMELLEGETLARRLERGPLPLPQALTLGGQIAEALGAAHRRGIVHRDLKPGNVMLTRSGAKLLDFGLARLGESGAAALEAASALTDALPLTREGTVVGTWPYLAPEQLSGRPADARSDVFALGAVLYEMITGRRAFPGATMAEVSAAILKESPPDPREQVPGLPGALVSVVRQCLAKDPSARWQNADDVALALRFVGETASSTASPGARRRPGLWPALTAAFAVVAALAVAGLWLRPGAPAAEPLRFVVPPPPGALLPRPNVTPVIAAAPDGRRVAFVANSGGVLSLWLWSAEDGEARRLEGTDGATGPFFSPDGREIAFFAADELRRIPVAGGPATRIAGAPSGNAGTWGTDGTILFTRWFGPESGLWSVPATGGDPRQRVPAPKLADLRAFPSFLPDGQHYLFLKGGFGGPAGERRACVASIDGGEPDCFAACDSQAVYAGTGHVLCVSRGTLVARPFDAARLQAGGEAFAVARGVRWFGPPGMAGFAVSTDGRLLVDEPEPSPSRLAWLDRGGREIGRLGEAQRYSSIELTRDGRRVGLEIWSRETGGRDLWSLDVSSGVSTRLTFERVDANSVVWSPDGTRFAYGRPNEGPPDVTVRSLDASSRPEVLLRVPGVQFPRHWSPDGRLIAYEDYMSSRRDQRQVWLLSLDGEHRRFRETPANLYDPRFSPDSRRLAYVSDESGRPEVYVAPVDGNGPVIRLSRAGGLRPRWRGDGREVLYFQPDGMMVSVDPRAEAAPPVVLFHLDGVNSSDFDYDVTADGQRFLVRFAPQPEGSAGLRLSLRWAPPAGGQAPD